MASGWTFMKPGSIVIVNLRNPTERLFGRLIEVTLAGVTIRGLDLAAFEHWIDGVSSQEPGVVVPSTLFLPMHRVDKVLLDEGFGGVSSLADTFRERVGTRINEHLE